MAAENQASFISGLRQVLFEVETINWWFRLSPQARERYEQIEGDIQFLRQGGYLPRNPLLILDVGSGSGAASVVLKRTYPNAKITAIDSRETHQPGQINGDPACYVVKPPGASFFPARVENFGGEHPGGFDLIIGARLPIIYDRCPTWEETCLHGAERILSLARLLAENGTFVFGYSNDGFPHPLVALQENFHLKRLFDSVNCIQGPSDSWLVLKSPNLQFDDPSTLLTEVGRSEHDPYQIVRPVLDWDA